MTVFGFQYDDFLDTVQVTVSDMVMTDADGEAVLVPPGTPVEALAPATIAALATPLDIMATRFSAAEKGARAAMKVAAKKAAEAAAFAPDAEPDH